MDESTSASHEWRPILLPLNLSPDIVHIVRVPLDISPARVTELSVCLSDEERTRAARFRFDEPRSRFVACRSALRELLGSCCGISPNSITLCYGPHGKPALVNEESATTSNIEFSISHSGNWGLIAITLDSPVGIDIEEFDPKVKYLRLAERFFAEAEAAELGQLPLEKQLQGFYRCWTCKEAYIKATGDGMSFPLHSFIVETDPDRPATLVYVVDQPDEVERWMIQAIDVDQKYAAAVMVANPRCRVESWDWNLH